MKKTRVKAPAMTVTPPQSRDEAAAQIRQIGDLNREVAKAEAAMNDAIAEITERHQPAIDALKERGANLSLGVQTWAEANRETLTEGGRRKTANLITGNLVWRARPPSVRVTGAEAVLDTLKRLGLGRFVRVREEVNKEAILNEPAAVAGVAGIAISSGVEDFVIEPFEQVAV
jgi:phage host-nuclease inhibitor protein Gam